MLELNYIFDDSNYLIFQNKLMSLQPERYVPLYFMASAYFSGQKTMILEI
jgi:hypothetical protein